MLELGLVLLDLCPGPLVLFVDPRLNEDADQMVASALAMVAKFDNAQVRRWRIIVTVRRPVRVCRCQLTLVVLVVVARHRRRRLCCPTADPLPRCSDTPVLGVLPCARDAMHRRRCEHGEHERRTGESHVPWCVVTLLTAVCPRLCNGSSSNAMPEQHV